MTEAFQFRYSGVATGRDYQSWRDEFSARWIAADFFPVSADRIVNEMRGTQHGNITICTTRGTPAQMIGRTERAQLSSRSLYLVIASHSAIKTVQRGKEHRLLPGQMGLMSTEEPAEVTQLTHGSRISLRLPRDTLAQMTLRLDDRVGRPVGANQPLRRLLMHQIKVAHRMGHSLGPSETFALAQHIIDLAALCIGANQDAEEVAARRGLASARLDAIKADVLRQVTDCSIRLSQVADRHNISERYVQQLFESAGTSFSSFVLEQRLLLAWKVLRDPTQRWRKISDIATASGFSDISYFNRAFRTRFDATPSDVRADNDCETAGRPRSPLL
jgi:AraC-like DNA-binding protein